MKKTGSIICLAVLIVSMMASVCFAGSSSLEIEKTYPRNEQKDTTKENMGVKLWFNNAMGDEESLKSNKDCFKIVDNKGKKLPIKVFYNPKDNKEVMVLVDATKNIRIADNTKYTLKIDGDLKDSSGNKLGEDTKITFTTLNTAKNNRVYMIMMGIMFVGMFVFSSRQMKKQMKEQQAENREKEEPFNPYKEAKKQGKSVEEVVAEHEKEMAKKAAKEARKATHRREDDDEEYEEEEESGNYKVKGPRPISAAGSTYITGRKAEAEARRAEEERLAKRRENAKKKKKK